MQGSKRGNIKTIVGAGKGQSTLYTYYNKKAGDVVPLPKKAARAAEVFAQQQAVEKMKFNAMVMQPLIKSWEDRNSSNQGTKLNP
jgi:hypothetical protein